MAGTSENPKIGLDHVVIAPLLSDDASGVTYGDVIELKGAVNASVNPNSDVAVDYADNGAFFAMNNRANTEMTLELTNVDPGTLAFMLGQRRSGGVTVESAMDAAPYCALGFRVWIGGTDASGDNIYEYFWFAKGKFSVPEAGGETKKDSVNFQHVTMTAQFMSTIFVPTGADSGTICTHCRSDIDTASGTVSAWFNAPVVDLVSQSNTITIASATLSGSTLTITGSATSATKFAASTVNAGNISVLTSGGAVCEGTFAVGTTAGTSPTITFTVTDSSTPATVAVSANVKDIYNVAVTPAVVSVA